MRRRGRCQNCRGNGRCVETIHTYTDVNQPRDVEKYKTKTLTYYAKGLCDVMGADAAAGSLGTDTEG